MLCWRLISYKEYYSHFFKLYRSVPQAAKFCSILEYLNVIFPSICMEFYSHFQAILAFISLSTFSSCFGIVLAHQTSVTFSPILKLFFVPWFLGQY